MKWFPRLRKLGGLEKVDENGQVYTEWYVSAPDKNDYNWARQCHSFREKQEGNTQDCLPAQDANSLVGAKGARSFQGMAVGSTLRNITHIPLEAFQAMPTWLVDRLWNEVIRRSYMSLEIWKKFCVLLQSREERTLRVMRYREVIELPRCPLKVYTAPLTSITYDFMTYLSITTAFSVPDLVKLSEVPNLGILEIVKTSEMGPRLVDDRLIRAWSTAATTEGAFSVLRILRLWNFEAVTSHSLELVDKFPLLGIYDVRGCSFSGAAPINARQLGWEVQVDINILHVLASACSLERTHRLTREHWLDANRVYNATPGQPWNDEKVYKIRREDVDAFLMKNRKDDLDPLEQRPGDVSYRLIHADPQALSGKVATRIFQHPDELIYGVSKWENAWDYHLSATYAYLGEFRGDKDISGRGINVGDQAVCCGELINSMPMASIRLGKHLPELRLESRYLATLNPGPAYHRPTISPGLDTKNLCFIRMKVPQVSEQGKNQSPACDERAPKRKASSRVMENKKMKLGDVLGSFM